MYANDTYDDFISSDLDFYANGVKLSQGYKFKEAGNKNFDI